MNDSPEFIAALASANIGLHPWVKQHVSEQERLGALRDELSWAVDVATKDMDFATGFAANSIDRGAAPTEYLNRWFDVDGGLRVLVGPRYRGLDPDQPFVSIDASTRPILPTDVSALKLLVKKEFAVFDPREVVLWSSAPVGYWPGGGVGLRLVAGEVNQLRACRTTPTLTATPATGVDSYDRYVDAYTRITRTNPAQAELSRLETREDLEKLAVDGTLLDLYFGGEWVGIAAYEPANRNGMRGFTVVVALLLPEYQSRGLGKDVSTLIALNIEGGGFLHGTIHAANIGAYRAALSAGRVDVGGEVVFALVPSADMHHLRT